MMSKKFPRIPHLPWSPGGTNDDKRLSITSHFINTLMIGVGNRIVITEKLDGSNLCMTRDALFSRSHSGPPIHISFNLAKKMHGEMAYRIPPGISVFGEWCYAVHSIEYDRLPGPYPFLVFGIRDDSEGWWYDWDTVEDVAINELGLTTVPVLFDGMVEDKFKELTQTLANGESYYGSESKEGIVVWPHIGLANDDDFSQQTAKWVKEGHPKDPDEHWMFKTIRKQGVLE